MNDKTDQQETGGEYLTFRLGDNEYGVDILAVQEIRAYEGVTSIPQAPTFIKGVIDLRGVVVPVVDLRVKLHLANVAYDSFTVMIVMAIAGRVVAIVVDSVSDVVQLAAGSVAPPPEFGSAFDSRYLKGMAKHDERMLILLDIERLIGSADLSLYSDGAVKAA